MGSFGVMVSILMLVTLTSTWASSSERPEGTTATEVKERHENLIKRYLRNEMKTIKGHEDSMENLIQGYLKNKADRLGRKSGRLGRKIRRSLHGNEKKEGVPFSKKRFEKMLEKAILMIITGDLDPSEMMLLKSLNYSREDVLAIRERELGKTIQESEVPEVLRGAQRLDAAKIDQKIIESGQSLTESSEPRDEDSEGNEDSKKGTKDSSTVSSSMPSKKAKNNHEKPDDDFDFDAYNRQAVYDYENAANEMFRQSELDPVSSIVDYEDHQVNDALQKNFDRASEAHVLFKIRYDDPEFDSTSDERARQLSKERDGASIVLEGDDPKVMKPRKSRDKPVSSATASWSPSKLSPSAINTTPGNHEDKPFQSPAHIDMPSSLPVVYRLGNFVMPHEEKDKTTTERGERLDTSGKNVDTWIKDKSVESVKSEVDETSSSTLESDNVQVDLLVKNESSDDFRRSGTYEGLEWVEDDVYRVIPQDIDALNYDNAVNDVDNDTIEDSDGNGNRTSDLDSRMFYDDRNDTTGYQNENPEDDNQSQQIRTNSSMRMPLNTSLSTYQQLALAHRKAQGQKAIEDIKVKILAMTGRFNLNSSINQVQRERLTMFSPTCQAPRNTDLETWSDPFSMNMHFQLNLTSDDHVVAAKMRIYKLPQATVTVPSSAAAVEEEDDEEKIRISIYFYTKSLKKHRSKKRLMDSVVSALTSQGSHLALDVRQALRFWRQNLRSSSHSNNNNHGLVIEVEDQDGRPLKPSQYIHQGWCHTSEQNEDDKAYQRVPALFIQACSRYVRVVNGEAVTYVNCSKSLRNDKH